MKKRECSLYTSISRGIVELLSGLEWQELDDLREQKYISSETFCVGEQSAIQI